MGAASRSLLQISIDGVDYTGEVGKCTVTSVEDDSDRRPLGQVPRSYFLNLALVVDHAAGSLWRRVFDATGLRVPILYKPYGNATATEEQPHYAAEATIAEPDGDLMGGTAAKRRRSRQTIEVAWKLTRKPIEVTS